MHGFENMWGWKKIEGVATLTLRLRSFEVRGDMSMAAEP
jgi:hypothetical protein